MKILAFVLFGLFVMNPALATDSVSDVKLEFGKMFSKYQQKYGNKYLSAGNTINSYKSKSSAEEFYIFYDEAISLMKRYSESAKKEIKEEKSYTVGAWNIMTFEIGEMIDDDFSYNYNYVSLRIDDYHENYGDNLFQLNFDVHISEQDKKNYDFGDQNIEGKCFESEGFFVEFSGCRTVEELENKKCTDGNFLIHRMLYECPVPD
ncbi:MAG: hypothetical protein FWG39_01990 [Alphaproteobacteria bacterium]|nr:hypothetical protein [Alphaproteobacteria bacterium]